MQQFLQLPDRTLELLTFVTHGFGGGVEIADLLSAGEQRPLQLGYPHFLRREVSSRSLYRPLHGVSSRHFVGVEAGEPPPGTGACFIRKRPELTQHAFELGRLRRRPARQQGKEAGPQLLIAVRGDVGGGGVGDGSGFVVAADEEAVGLVEYGVSAEAA